MIRKGRAGQTSQKQRYLTAVKVVAAAFTAH